MSILSPNAAATGALTTLQNAVSTTGNGTVLTVGPHTMLTFEVTGTWVGILKCQGYVTGTDTYTDLAVYRLDGRRCQNITENGIYQVDVSGLTGVRVRVNTWTSGTSVTVAARLSRDRVATQARVADIFNTTTAEIASGANADVTPVLDVSGYVYLRVGVRGDSSGDFTVRYLPYLRPDTSFPAYGQPQSFDDVLFADLRGYSELIEVKGRGALFNIANGSAGAHTYAITVIGYR